MHASTILYGLVFLQGAMASPIGDSSVDVEPRAIEPEGLETRDIEPRGPVFGDVPFPKLPAMKRKGLGAGCSSTEQTALCSSGSSYCCTGDGKGGR
ncbi:hypothetical protein MRS44_008430 [Fusarium solani]|uniref:uncharacterized protein n=1 Tax=Fusarium solani TaxID=169388 RepID=UPI002321CE9D|nr:hypothetical protein MRS44_008430 [Fusarium solani]KAJ4197116.1 hypothetical protein NW759_016345 [Fusarium solani]